MFNSRFSSSESVASSSASPESRPEESAPYSSSLRMPRPSDLRRVKSAGAKENLPARDRRLNLFNSAFCLLTSLSRLELIAISELLDISKSRTFRSRRASAASCDTDLVGLNAKSEGDPINAGEARVSMEGSSGLGLAALLMGVVLVCANFWVRGEFAPSAAVFDLLLG